MKPQTKAERAMRPAPKGSRRFQLVATVQQECCDGSHLWFQPIMARTAKAAGKRLARIIEKNGADVHEIADITDNHNAEFVWERDQDYTATFGEKGAS